MSLMADWEIRDWACGDTKMIDPFVDEQIARGVVSYGNGHYGYDIRLGSFFKVFGGPMDTYGLVINPKKTDWHRGFKEFRDVQPGEIIVIPPNSFCLAETLETFNVPRHVLAIILGKSTYARCGLIVNCTPAEPEWKGRLTLELSNTTPLPIEIYAGEGIAQMLFHKASSVCSVSYADKKGRYQSQIGLTMPTVHGCPETKE